MTAIFSAFSRGLTQLSDPRTRAVVWTSVGWTTLIFVGTWVSIAITLKVTTFIAIGWLESVFDFLSGAGAVFLTWFLFPPVVIAVGGLLLERVVDAVEARHYPDQPLPPGQSVAAAIGGAMRFLGAAIGLNLLCLPFLFFGPVYFVIYYGLNGYLLSREYFEVVATRRLNNVEATRLRKAHQTPLVLIGSAYAFFLTVPILNLITPVVATAAMVHLFERWRDKDTSGGTAVDVRTAGTEVGPQG